MSSSPGCVTAGNPDCWPSFAFVRRGEVLLHDGLVLFDGPDQPTARAEAIYAGGALSWNQEDLN